MVGMMGDDGGWWGYWDGLEVGNGVNYRNAGDEGMTGIDRVVEGGYTNRIE